jgi:hypothetical protein
MAYDFQMIDDGKAYWEIVNRVRRNKSTPLMIRAAFNDMNRLLPTVKNPAVRNRILQWMSHNHKYSPRDNGGGSGPRTA